MPSVKFKLSRANKLKARTTNQASIHNTSNNTDQHEVAMSANVLKTVVTKRKADVVDDDQSEEESYNKRKVGEHVIDVEGVLLDQMATRSVSESRGEKAGEEEKRSRESEVGETQGLRGDEGKKSVVDLTVEEEGHHKTIVDLAEQEGVDEEDEVDEEEKKKLAEKAAAKSKKKERAAKRKAEKKKREEEKEAAKKKAKEEKAVEEAKKAKHGSYCRGLIDALCKELAKDPKEAVWALMDMVDKILKGAAKNNGIEDEEDGAEELNGTQEDKSEEIDEDEKLENDWEKPTEQAKRGRINRSCSKIIRNILDDAPESGTEVFEVLKMAISAKLAALETAVHTKHWGDKYAKYVDVDEGEIEELYEGRDYDF